MGIVSRVLHLYNRLGECATHTVRVATVAQQCSLSERTVEAWIAAARTSASAFGMKAPAIQNDGSFEPVPAADVDLHHATVHALHDLAERFDKVAHAHPALLREALEIAVSRFNLRRHDVCFRGERDEVAARRFLKMLNVAGLVPDRCRLTVRRLDAADTKLPHWFRSTRAQGMQIKRIPPPGTSRSQARAYARWVGVQLCGPERGPEGHAWRIGLFLACVAFTRP